MAKTYINTIKYKIVAKFEIKGIVDKHDIIGAVFGQSEGLIGEDMDLKELQKGGKIGRIEVEVQEGMGTTTGSLIIPSSMDMVKTSILAAAVEVVDKVGPCESTFEVTGIEDTRSAKRDSIKERAQELLQKMRTEEIPETETFAEAIRSGVRAADLINYGQDKLPASSGIEKEESIILVEGRADVINLLKHNVKAVIGIGGSAVPKTIIDLCRGKEVTVFIDGDRGGELNLRNLEKFIKIAFVARAPDGKEVEELVRKEIEACFKKKVSPADFFSRSFRGDRGSDRAPYKRSYERRPYSGAPGGRDRQGTGGRDRPYPERRSYPERSYEHRPVEPKIGKVEEVSKEAEPFQPVMKELQDSLKGRLLDAKGKTIKEVGVRDLLAAMGSEKKVNAVVFDGIVTKRLAEEAEKIGIKYLVGVKKGRTGETKNVKVLTISS